MSAAEGTGVLRAGSLRPLGLAVGVAGCSAMPMLLTGALAVQMREDLAFSSPQLGFALAGFLCMSGLTSPLVGRLADRVGWHWMVVGAACITAFSLAGTALWASSYAGLLVLLCVGGLAQAIGQTTGNLLLAREAPEGRRGLFFGVKQSAIPLGGLLAGMAVPLIALPLGWRWAFGAAAALPVVLVVAVLSRPPTVNARPRPRTALPPGYLSRSLMLLAVGISLGSMAVGALGFLAVAAVDAGASPASAGLMVALASATGLLARVFMGWLVDRGRTEPLVLVAWLLLAGAGGFALLGVHTPWAVALGAVLAHSAGWGWPGVLLHGVVALHPRAPGAATGVIGSGTAGGAAVGPVLFGLIVYGAGFRAAWVTSAVLAVLSAGMVLRSARSFRQAGTGEAAQ